MGINSTNSRGGTMNIPALCNDYHIREELKTQTSFSSIISRNTSTQSVTRNRTENHISSRGTRYII